MDIAADLNGIRWTVARRDAVVMFGFAVLLVVAFISGLGELARVWEMQEEYSFGYMIPVVTLYLLWQRRTEIAATRFSGAWGGTALVAFGLLALGIGQIATLGTVVQYAFLCCLFGLIVSYTGWRGVAAMAMPLAILGFMVPLPNYFLREISQALQLWSSQLGVMFIRAFGISVFLEGNVIDLGGLRLQVVEACNGLRYLLPLMSIGFIAAYLFRAALWKRALVFLSTIPITLLMNSVRIGVIGVLSEYFGKSMAEGFLHDFEGWAVFMLCTLLLVVEIALLARFGADKAAFAEVFAVPVAKVPPATRDRTRALPMSFVVAGMMIAIAAGVSHTVSIPSATLPARQQFADFPMALGSWRGVPARMEAEYLRMLKLDDYLLADFVTDARRPVNFYVSYYAAQANGNSAHSPRACIPGDGWEISDFGQRELREVVVAGRSLEVNRVVIQRGDNRQLVYYWFQQGGRAITNEYMVKLRIFQDAVTRRRTDGAMVRLVAALAPGESVESGDALLERFAVQAVPTLAGFVPD